MSEQLTYYPAGLPALVINLQKKKVPKHEDVKLDWWSKNACFKYPKLLVSAYYAMDYDNFREKIGFPKEGKIMGDSGGYQLFSFQVKGIDKTKTINPVSVLKWQEKNCDIGIILDFPIFNNDRKTFDHCLKITSENAKTAVEHRTRYKKDGFMLYNVLQSTDYNKAYLDIWLDEMKQYDLDGWCISCKPGATPLFIALDAMYLYSKGYKENFHILGASGRRTISVMAWLSRYIKNVTFDSSAYYEGGKRRTYSHPIIPLKGGISFGNTINNTLERLPCFCPVCKLVEDPKFFNTEGSLPGGIMSLHNLYCLIDYTKKLDILKEDRKAYYDYVNAALDNQVKMAIEFIEYSIEYGFDEAFVKFRRRFLSEGENVSTGNLMDF